MKIILRVAVSIGALVLILLFLPWNEFLAAVSRLSPWVWLAVLLVFLGGHRLGVAKWRLLVNAGHSAELGQRDAVRCYAAGLFANLCLPSIVGGDVLRGVLAARATGRTAPVLLGGITDRLLDVLALGVLILAGGALARDAVPEAAATAVTGLLAIGLVLPIVLVLALRRPLAFWPRRLRRPVGRILVAARRVRRRPAPAVTALAIALLMQSGFVLLNAWIGRSIGIGVPIAVWFLVWPLAKLTGLLPISLGGLGVRDATLGGLLVPLGVPLATGVAASLIWQTILIAAGLLAGGVYLALGRGRTGRSRRNGLDSAPAAAADRA